MAGCSKSCTLEGARFKLSQFVQRDLLAVLVDELVQGQLALLNSL